MENLLRVPGDAGRYRTELLILHPYLCVCGVFQRKPMRKPKSVARLVAWLYLAFAICFCWLIAISMFERSLINATEINREVVLEAISDGAFYFLFNLTASPLTILAVLVVLSSPRGTVAHHVQ